MLRWKLVDDEDGAVVYSMPASIAPTDVEKSAETAIRERRWVLRIAELESRLARIREIVK